MASGFCAQRFSKSWTPHRKKWSNLFAQLPAQSQVSSKLKNAEPAKWDWIFMSIFTLEWTARSLCTKAMRLRIESKTQSSKATRELPTCSFTSSRHNCSRAQGQQAHPPESFSRVQFFERTEPGAGYDVDAQQGTPPASASEFAVVRCRKGHSLELGKVPSVCR